MDWPSAWQTAGNVMIVEQLPRKNQNNTESFL